MNRYVGSGYIATEPELRYTQSQIAVCSFSLAIRRNRDFTDFVPVVCWRDTAIFVTKYFKKGSRIEIDGHLQQRTWEDQNGRHSRIEVVAGSVAFGERALAGCRDAMPQEAPHTPEESGCDPDLHDRNTALDSSYLA